MSKTKFPDVSSMLPSKAREAVNQFIEARMREEGYHVSNNVQYNLVRFLGEIPKDVGPFMNHVCHEEYHKVHERVKDELIFKWYEDHRKKWDQEDV